MNRRKLSLGVAALGLLLVTGPALAHDPSGSGEEKKVMRNCDAPADPKYSPPGENDCQRGPNGEPPTTYEATHYSNDVTCNKEPGGAGTATPAGRLYTKSDAATQSGSIVLCNDKSSGEVSPVQGRVIVAGDRDNLRVTADGDKDNSTDGSGSQTGWATVRRSGSTVTVTCGDEYNQNGRGDSDHPAAEDTQAECVPGS